MIAGEVGYGSPVPSGHCANDAEAHKVRARVRNCRQIRLAGVAGSPVPYAIEIGESNPISSPAARAKCRFSNQNGLTTTSTTIAIKSSVGNSFAMRKKRGEYRLRSAAKLRRQRANT
jgi:hypothetical protein